MHATRNPMGIDEAVLPRLIVPCKMVITTAPGVWSHCASQLSAVSLTVFRISRHCVSAYTFPGKAVQSLGIPGITSSTFDVRGCATSCRLKSVWIYGRFAKRTIGRSEDKKSTP